MEFLKRKGENKILKGQVFDVNGKEIYEPVQVKSQVKSLRDKYKDAEMHTEYGPYSETEFCEFVKEKDEMFVNSIICAGQFLKQIEGLPHKDTLRGMIADYIVDELVINEVAHKHPDEVSRRAYASYRMLYYRNMNQKL